MFKSMLATSFVSSMASGVAAISGTVTAVQVLRGKQPTTAATVTLGAVGVSLVSGAVAAVQMGRLAKKMTEEATAE